MNKELEDMLQGLAFSNFYLKLEKGSCVNPATKLLVGRGTDRNYCHIAPEEGNIGFECGERASANPIGACWSEQPGVIRVRPDPETCLSCQEYFVHQTRDTFQVADFEVITVEEYRNL